MARGKYLSLDEARRLGKIRQFCAEHQTTGDKAAFDRLLDAMAQKANGTDQDRPMSKD